MEVQTSAVNELLPGVIVRAAEDLYNDGGVPDVPAGELLAAAGARGVVVKVGHVEAMPDVAIYLVRFQGADEVLGPPVGCLGEELVREEAAPAAAH